MMTIKNDTYHFCVRCVARVFGIVDRFDAAMEIIDKHGCQVDTNSRGEPVYDVTLYRNQVRPDYRNGLSFSITVSKKITENRHEEVGVGTCLFSRGRQDWIVDL